MREIATLLIVARNDGVNERLLRPTPAEQTAGRHLGTGLYGRPGEYSGGSTVNKIASL
jgi:hypothetical protein